MIFLTFLLSDGNKVMFLLAMLPNLKIKDIRILDTLIFVVVVLL